MKNYDKEINRMNHLIEVLNEASKSYYQEDREIISNLEYDRLYDELLDIEKKTGITKSDSPTVKVGFEIVKNLPKEEHRQAMLSLDKTKSVDELYEWSGNKDIWISWKLDGLTIVLTYENGNLVKAVTRGNGQIGEVVTNNAKVFKNLPLKIEFKGRLVIRGEAVISYKDFQLINEKIVDIESKYKNPRNLCSGSVRQLNNEITKDRNIRFYAFSIAEALENNVDLNFDNSVAKQMLWLKSQGFDIVDGELISKEILDEKISQFSKAVASYPLATDGLVLVFDDIAYGESLGATSKFPRNAIAFKWKDEVKETVLKEILWSPSRTGLVNPIAIFDPVELEGTTVSRASVHNVSILRELSLKVGDRITVYKANMIIPQIAENLSEKGNVNLPKQCPSCDSELLLKAEQGVETLHCINEECSAKKIKSYSHFVSRDAMNIDSLSENTIIKLISIGAIKEYADFYRLYKFKDEIISMEGFGEKSYSNLIQAIDNSRKTDGIRLLYSLGIAGVGLSNAKSICKFFKNNWKNIQNARYEDLIQIDGIGEIMAGNFVSFFANENKIEEINSLLDELVIDESFVETTGELDGKTFVITGSLDHFTNRNALKEFIESKGGRVASSVSSNTDFLINNNKTSTSSKNKKALELGVEIISEEDFLSMV